MADMDELMWPDWLDALGMCPFCGHAPEVKYDPLQPLAAMWHCHECGANGVTSPPYDVVPITHAVIPADGFDNESDAWD